MQKKRSYKEGRFKRKIDVSVTLPLAIIASRPGILNLLSVTGRGRNERFRTKLDLLYANQASLGLDLYILYRVVGRKVLQLDKKRSFSRLEKTAA